MVGSDAKVQEDVKQAKLLYVDDPMREGFIQVLSGSTRVAL